MRGASLSREVRGRHPASEGLFCAYGRTRGTAGPQERAVFGIIASCDPGFLRAHIILIVLVCRDDFL